MRLLIINLVSVAILVAGAMTANAAVISFQNFQALGGADINALNPGDRISVEMYLDTEGATNVSSIFLSAFYDTSLLAIVPSWMRSLALFPVLILLLHSTDTASRKALLDDAWHHEPHVL